jgi:hypothetical protein
MYFCAWKMKESGNFGENKTVLQSWAESSDYNKNPMTMRTITLPAALSRIDKNSIKELE